MLTGLMIIGWLIDCVRIGREGLGGLIVLLSGMADFDNVFRQTFPVDRRRCHAGSLDKDVWKGEGLLYFPGSCGQRF